MNNIFKQVKQFIDRNPEVHIRQLFPDSRRKGMEIYFDNPSYNSWSYNIVKRVVKDFRTNTSEDLIESYRKINGLSSPIDAVKQMASLLGVQIENSQTQTTQDIAHKVWRDSHHIMGTIAENYLIGRRINSNTLRSCPSLRYHDKIYHSVTRTMHPALLAKIVDLTGHKYAIHRTYLRTNGTKLFDSTSSNSKQNKKVLGSFRGWHIALGERDHDIKDGLIICEGIESGLSLLQDVGKLVWCAISAGNIDNLELPPSDEIRLIDIRPDVDPSKVGIYAARRAAKKWEALGYSVKITLPKLRKKNKLKTTLDNR